MPRTDEIRAGSASVVLVYADDGRTAAGVPARDLTANDIVRLAYVRRLSVIGQDVGRPSDPADPESEPIAAPDPRDPDPDDVRAVLDELMADGIYSNPKEPKSSKPTPEKPADQPAQPDQPAPTQEG